MNIINISSDMFFYLSLVWLVFFRYISISKKKEKLNKTKELMIILFGIYVLKVISLVFFPIIFQFGDNIVRRNPIIFLNPITSIIYIFKYNDFNGIFYNIVGNIMLLFPLPTFIAYFYRHKFDRLLSIFLICLLISISIECIQYIESILIAGVGRFFEVNDILLNTFGGILGYIIFDKYIRKFTNKN